MNKPKVLKYKVLPIRLEEGQYRSLRKMAYLNEISMANMIRQLIDNHLNINKKVLTNSDIAI